MSEQINPPFDGSAPCPLCSNEVRSVWASVHNMLNRWRETEPYPEGKFWVRIADLDRCSEGKDDRVCNPNRRTLGYLQDNATNPEVRDFLATTGVLLDVYRAHRDPEARGLEQMKPLIDAIKPAVDVLRSRLPGIAKLNEAHFDDARHSQGNPNILRSQQGYSDERGGNYHWTVDVADPQTTGQDLRHIPCDTKLILHSHFRERIARDRAWYGKVWCPTCQLNAPWAQFECRA